MAAFTRFLFVIFLLGIVYEAASTQQCNGPRQLPIHGKMLKRHIYETRKARSGHAECLFVCREKNLCQSFNFVIAKSVCEFNNRTKEASPKDFVDDPDRYYVKLDVSRVTLGSIPELPAKSCREIKLNEGGQAASQKYWFYSVIPGTTVLAYCDMKLDDIDECSVSPSLCHHNATCKNNVGSYVCSCKEGFTGNGKTCIDINECSTSPSVCHHNADCRNNVGSYVCSCKVGFTGNGKTCSDIDECITSPSVCHRNADCRNDVGSYVCSCEVGFTGNGKKCNDINECITSPWVCHRNADCRNDVGSYVCSCKVGFAGDGKTCSDINECITSPWVCHRNADCRNDVGSYVCSCKMGFAGDGKTCSDINECKTSPWVCHRNADCRNDVGSYVCSCKVGFTGNGKTCSDINECIISPWVCHRNADCRNDVGSYVCSCKVGFTGNGKTCSDINECITSPWVCHRNADCRNDVGSYVCSCKVGFTGNGKTCSDINECAGNHGCDVNADCTNTPGTYSCTCRPAYDGDGRNCKLTRGLRASSILNSKESKYREKVISYLADVVRSSSRSRFERCWHATTDGWASSTFHRNCDGKGPTVTIIEVGRHIFGGYSDVSWDDYNPCGYASYGTSTKAFIFSLYNIYGYNPVKLVIPYGQYDRAVYSCFDRGPSFGSGNDIYISDNAGSNKDSYTYCDSAYPLPSGYYSSGSSCRFYAGGSSYTFTPTDIEVFYETTSSKD